MPESPISHQPRIVWFRYCLLTTAVFNLFGAISFAPPIYYRMADTFGLPKDTMPFGLWVIASWIFIFGLGYAWLSIQHKPENLFVAVAAACKVTIAIFFFIFWLTGDFIFWLTGDLPSISLFSGCGDFLFAIIFILWLFQSQQEVR